jgi:hypothetical protein
VTVKSTCKGQPSAVCVCNAPGIVGRRGTADFSDRIW